MAVTRVSFIPMPADARRGSVSGMLSVYQRVLILALFMVLLLLLVVVSGMIMRQQSRFLEDSLARRGAATLQHIAQLAPEPLRRKRWNDLAEMARLAAETDEDIMGIAFYSPAGERLLFTGDVGPLPIRPENIPSVVSTRDYVVDNARVFISPIQARDGTLIGLSYLRQTRFKVIRLAVHAAARLDGMILGVFIVLGLLMNFLIRRLRLVAEREAQSARELASAYHRLQVMQTQLIEAEKMSSLGRLASSMAHELRNPLGAIKNALYYLRDALRPTAAAKEDPTLEEFIGIADQEVKGATRIITDLLDFSRGVRLTLQPTDLNAVVRHVCAMLTVPPNVRLDCRYDDALPLIPLDPERLRQVFANLATNALQALEAKGGTLTVRTSLLHDAGGAMAAIDFIDDGCGIPRENREKVFEPLFTTKAKGSGLGLAISLAIAKAHGGTIEILDPMGPGAVLRVRLPVAPKESRGA